MAASGEAPSTGLKGIALQSTTVSLAAGSRVAIVRTEWNRPIIDALVGGARAELLRHGIAESDIVEEFVLLPVLQVPGAYELPFGAKCAIAGDDRITAVLCIGCLIKGETMHFEYIAEAVTQGIMRLQLDTGVPVIFGVLTVLNEQQALARAGLTPDGHNHGVEWGQTAVRMAAFAQRSFHRKA